MLQSERVSKIFTTHDVDESGALSYDELIPALRAELKEAGVTARLTAGDVLSAIGTGAERGTAEEVEAYIEERVPVQ